MDWTMGVWFVVGVLLGISVGAIVWRRKRQKSVERSEQKITVDEASYGAQVERLEHALSKAEQLVHEKSQRLHSAESQRSALHAQFEVTHARMTQFRELLAEATSKLKLEHSARRAAEEQVRGLDGLVQAVQAQLVRMENERKQLSVALAADDKPQPARVQEIRPESDWEQRVYLLKTAIKELKQANEELAHKLALTENKLMSRTFELRAAEEKVRSFQLSASNAY